METLISLHSLLESSQLKFSRQVLNIISEQDKLTIEEISNCKTKCKNIINKLEEYTQNNHDINQTNQEYQNQLKQAHDLNQELTIKCKNLLLMYQNISNNISNETLKELLDFDFSKIQDFNQNVSNKKDTQRKCNF